MSDKSYHREYYLKNRTKILARVKSRYSIKSEDIKKYAKDYYKSNKSRQRALSKLWKKNNKEAYRKLNRKYINKRLKRDPAFRIKKSLRDHLGIRVRTGIAKKHCSVLGIIGCTPAFLVNHIQSLWLPGMSWENYGIWGWHIDHIRPCASFDLTDPEQQKQCFHYTNLQPLWAKDNWDKGCKYNEITH